MKNKEIIRHFRNKRIIVTGHTGFKGAWLCFILNLMGAKVIGISNGRFNKNYLYDVLKLKNKIININCDVRNFKNLEKIFKKYKPYYLFHFAAEALVSKAFDNPKLTWETNTLGTVNILEILKKINFAMNAVIITSDKVYRNVETSIGYKETDQLGDFDPYSSSKASADLAVQSYFKSFLKNKKNLRIGVARAGNVIGGGDWAFGRLIPDCIKSWSKNKKVIIRNPNSTRPWQHVFDVLRGYILLSINIKKNIKLNGEAFNFGPKKDKNQRVISLVKIIHNLWGKGKWSISKKNKLKEAKLLSLNSNKSKINLKWKSKLNTKNSLILTIEWYKSYFYEYKNIEKFSKKIVQNFFIK